MRLRRGVVTFSSRLSLCFPSSVFSPRALYEMPLLVCLHFVAPSQMIEQGVWICDGPGCTHPCTHTHQDVNVIRLEGQTTVLWMTGYN